MHPNQISGLIIGAGIEVHRHLGPGLLESTYEGCLQRELEMRGLRVCRQRKLPVTYKGLRLEDAYRVDLIVEETVIVEVKAVEALAPIHEAQLLTYMKLGGWHRGLLINFNVPVLTQGIRRMALGLSERPLRSSANSAPPR